MRRYTSKVVVYSPNEYVISYCKTARIKYCPYIERLYPEPYTENLNKSSPETVFYADFWQRIKYNDGFAYLFEVDNDETPIEEIFLGEPDEGKCSIENGNRLVLHFSADSLKNGKSYYIRIEENALKLLDDGGTELDVSYPGLADNVWTFSTGGLFTPVEPSSIENKEFSFRSSLKDDDSIKYTFDYNDDWVFSDNKNDCYNLMQTSIRVAMAAYGAKEDDGYGPANIKSMMDTMGFEYVDDGSNPSIYYPTPNKQNVDTIGSAIGLKNLKMPDGSIRSIILVAIRSGGYGAEWGGNFRVGNNSLNSDGFNIAKLQVIDRLKRFFDDYKQYISDDLRIWFSGYSRGGATSNLVAAALIDGTYKLDGVSSDEVMAFCFECPNTTTDQNARDSKYDKIINMVNPNDFVPRVPLANKWNFNRYGKTLYTPSQETASDYSDSYHKTMVSYYKKIFDYNNIRYNSGVFYEMAGQGSLLDGFFDYLGEKISRDYYYKYYQASAIDIAASTLGKAGGADWIAASNQLLSLLGIANDAPALSGTIISGFAIGFPPPLQNAHYPELCLSWVDCLENDYKIANFISGGILESTYRVLYANCPVNIAVRNSEGRIVGQIENDVVKEIENGIVTRIDKDGQKVFILPSDEEYSIDVKATDNGEFNYSVQEYNFDRGITNKVINYKNIEINAGDELFGTATEILENDEAEYTLQHKKDGTVFEPNEVLSGDEIVKYAVEVTNEGNGSVTGGGYYVKGEFAKATATADEGYEFNGWYVDGERVSEESEYRFAVEEDTVLTADFSEKVSDFKGKTTRGDMFNLANNVKVTWKEVPGAKYYKVYRYGLTNTKETRRVPVIVTTGLVGWDKEPGLTNGHKYKYTIIASMTGKGDSSGDSPLYYTKIMYRLKTVVIRSVKNTVPGGVLVKYDKTTSGDSYVLQYSDKADMSGAKTRVVKGANTTSYMIGGLKKGKTYYISIRVRKTVDGINYYTTFGVPTKVTITK